MAIEIKRRITAGGKRYAARDLNDSASITPIFRKVLEEHAEGQACLLAEEVRMSVTTGLLNTPGLFQRNIEVDSIRTQGKWHGPFEKSTLELELTPLSEKRVKEKMNPIAGPPLDDRILIATGDYVRNIVVEESAPQDGMLAFAVRPANKIHDGERATAAQETLQDIAQIHEFGTDKVPPRPHWTPAKDHVTGIWNTTTTKQASFVIREALGKAAQ